MTENNQKLLELWKRIEDARLQCHYAHRAVRKINQDSAGIPSPDGNYAFRQTLRAEVLAQKNHLHALEEYYAALVPEDQQPADEKAERSQTHAENAITPREREVLKLIASGRSSKQIAEELGMAFRTAVAHRYHLYRKLKIHTNVELTRAAMRRGLIEL